MSPLVRWRERGELIIAVANGRSKFIWCRPALHIRWCTRESDAAAPTGHFVMHLANNIITIAWACAFQFATLFLIRILHYFFGKLLLVFFQFIQ